MLTICDTHALIHAALDTRRLSANALRSIESAERSGELACADISLWEIGMLIQKGRLAVVPDAREFLETMVRSRGLRVFPITAEIAALADSDAMPRGDPADRLIAATAITHGAPLVTKDKQLAKVPGLRTIW
jgi:PIN domain nuclease of toxin-antitoxin system